MYPCRRTFRWQYKLQKWELVQRGFRSWSVCITWPRLSLLALSTQISVFYAKFSRWQTTVTTNTALMIWTYEHASAGYAYQIRSVSCFGSWYKFDTKCSTECFYSEIITVFRFTSAAGSKAPQTTSIKRFNIIRRSSLMQLRCRRTVSSSVLCCCKEAEFCGGVSQLCVPNFAMDSAHDLMHWFRSVMTTWRIREARWFRRINKVIWGFEFRHSCSMIPITESVGFLFLYCCCRQHLTGRWHEFADLACPPKWVST